MIGKINRYFNPDWYEKYVGNWLEYSEAEDNAYCLCCYLFRDNIKGNKHGHDAFAVDGFRNWNKPERFVSHVGDSNSKNFMNHNLICFAEKNCGTKFQIK